MLLNRRESPHLRRCKGGQERIEGQRETAETHRETEKDRVTETDVKRAFMGLAGGQCPVPIHPVSV